MGRFTLVQGEVYEGNAPGERVVRATISLENQTARPLSLLAPVFKLHLSTGVELAGSPQVTAQLGDACPLGDVSVGSSARCSIGFLVDASVSQATFSGISYTLVDGSQWLVSRNIPTCEQCGLLFGCVDFARSNHACGRCGTACTLGQGCLAGACVATTVVRPTAATCQATCGPRPCRGAVVLASCSPARAFDYSCSTPLSVSGCATAELACECAQ